MNTGMDSSRILQTGFGFWGSKMLLTAEPSRNREPHRQRPAPKRLRSHESLNMLIEFGDAFDFTGADFRGWCKEAGFKRYEVLSCTGISSAIEAYE